MTHLFLGILYDDGTMDNDASIKRLAEITVAYAAAGIVAYILDKQNFVFAYYWSITNGQTNYKYKEHDRQKKANDLHKEL